MSHMKNLFQISAIAKGHDAPRRSTLNPANALRVAPPPKKRVASAAPILRGGWLILLLLCPTVLAADLIHVKPVAVTIQVNRHQGSMVAEGSITGHYRMPGGTNDSIATARLATGKNIAPSSEWLVTELERVVAAELRSAGRTNDTVVVLFDWYDTHQPSSALPVDPPAASLVNINTATAAELDALPGIGPSLATKIIAARPFASIDDLLRVSGIGVSTLENLRPLVTTE